MQQEIQHIENILESFLGESKNGTNYNGWTSYCCPSCAEEKGVENDGKFNLEVNITQGSWCHCWRCGYSGKLSKLIREYGGMSLLQEYKEALKSIQASQMYAFGADDDTKFEEAQTLYLPQGFKKIKPDDPNAKFAYEYLAKRGLNQYFIDKFNIGYTGIDAKDYSMRQRIVIPSYDFNNDLNYWVGRDYTGTSNYRYKNPKVEKRQIVFNENLVNWYEDIVLVEGPFDHIVVPNSIPLLGKTIDSDHAVYKALYNQAKQNVIVFLDDDAYENAVKMYNFLDNGNLRGRIRLIECPQGLDASDIYKTYHARGMAEVIRSAKKLKI